MREPDEDEAARAAGVHHVRRRSHKQVLKVIVARITARLGEPPEGEG